MSERFDRVVQIMSRLRGEGGCPWDRKQTRESLKPYLVEEAYEVLETIEMQDEAKLKEELGDVLLQVLFHAQIGRERKTFTIEDVLETLAEKLIRRHPHVFGEAKVGTGGSSAGPPPAKNVTAEEVVHRWEEIKRQEKAVGDLLFALVNLARLVKVNPEEALRGAANRFAQRFVYMEEAAKRSGRALSDMTLAEMDRLWDEAKASERKP